MSIDNLLKKRTTLLEEISDINKIINRVIYFDGNDLLSMMNKLASKLEPDVKFSMQIKPNNIVKDLKICYINVNDIQTGELKGQYEMIRFNPVNNLRLRNDDLKYEFLFSFIWVAGHWRNHRVGDSRCDIEQNFPDRPYIEEFIRYVVDYRLEHLDEEIDYDVVASEFVEQYRSKQKVLTPEKPQD